MWTNILHGVRENPKSRSGIRESAFFGSGIRENEKYCSGIRESTPPWGGLVEARSEARSQVLSIRTRTMQRFPNFRTKIWIFPNSQQNRYSHLNFFRQYVFVFSFTITYTFPGDCNTYCTSSGEWIILQQQRKSFPRILEESSLIFPNSWPIFCLFPNPERNRFPIFLNVIFHFPTTSFVHIMYKILIVK
jgi:hypothetical protein